MPHSTNSSASVLSEQLIQDSFHSYLRSSLTQAKLERLLDEDLLSSAEADLMITGPALCLFFAALRSTTNPPSVPLPRLKNPNSSSTANPHHLPTQPTELSYENCPPAFVSFLRVWAKNVPLIQGLAPEYQHDVARVVCGLPPIAQPVDASINGIAADLRGVAIEISQRRSFQERYGSALQAALDSGGSSSGTATNGGASNLHPKRASFVPPPVYEPSPPPSPRPSGRPSLESPSTLAPPPTLPPRHGHRPTASDGSIRYSHSNSSSVSSTTSSSLQVPPSPTSPSLFTFDSPAIEFIRETLYASLADQLERLPSLRKQLRTDPTRAYFGSVSFAILDVAMNSITPNGEVIGVLGKNLTLGECPPPLRPFFSELVSIGREARRIEEQDTELVVKMIAEGQEGVPTPRLERVKSMLQWGIGVERDGSRRDKNGERERKESVQGRAVAFANRISALALGLTKLKAFRERQDYVFKVLESIGT
ncbi:hypothetical protein D9611_001531 [Ephemerocybe angulata]|uniref:Uncharacterized protein n=1 Tax=Ephemerocybe angulata TaxID=980116 RepID=A0A8H5CHP9_9AGAR|nr:hypothetical protein D9611_001531 [Tulosesus angulatus]